MSEDMKKEYCTCDEQTESLRCNGTGSHDEVVMESLGSTEADCPNYAEEDDVSSSIAEGYF